MAEYQVGSLGNLISGKGDNNSGAKIVYEKVTPNSRVSKKSHEGQMHTMSKASTFREKKKDLKKKISSPFVKRNKPEIAGDEEVEGTVPKSWNRIAESDGSAVVADVQAQSEKTFSQNAARRINIKKNTKRHVDEPEREARTIFVGNIPYAHSKKKKLMKFFSKYGNVESMRLRCAPLKDPRMSKKVAVIKHEFHPERSSICAFIVFKTESEANNAKEANGAVYHDHHLRVDMAGNAAKKEFDPKRSVFIGNVSFSAEEEDLWELFSKCGAIESVRIVRDPVTAVSKGIAFVNFQDGDAAELALQLDGETLKKRSIAVRRHKPNAKSLEKASDSNTRHKGAKPVDEKTKQKQKLKEDVRLQKKEKRKMRREGEKLLGIVKKKKINDGACEATKMEEDVPAPKEKKGKSKTGTDESENTTDSTFPRGGKKARFQGQTVEDLKKKKKKINKGELKKRTVAHLLGGSLQKKKKV